MKISRSLLFVSPIIVLSTVAFAQPGAIPAPLNPGVLSDSYQIQVLTNGSAVQQSNAFITNAGELGASATPSANIGNICVNMYTFGAQQQEIRCCSCLVPPNGLVQVTLNEASTTGEELVVKLIATIPGTSTAAAGTNAGPFTGTVCNAAATFTTANLAPGMRAWLSPSTFSAASPFQSANLSSGELTKLTSVCASPAGVCPVCSH